MQSMLAQDAVVRGKLGRMDRVAVRDEIGRRAEHNTPQGTHLPRTQIRVRQMTKADHEIDVGFGEVEMLLSEHELSPDVFVNRQKLRDQRRNEFSAECRWSADANTAAQLGGVLDDLIACGHDL